MLAVPNTVNTNNSTNATISTAPRCEPGIKELLYRIVTPNQKTALRTEISELNSWRNR